MTTRKTYEQFSGLSSDEMRQLCYIAYFGESYGSAISTYLKAYHKSRKTYDSTLLKLQQLGYVTGNAYVIPEHHLNILDFLATEKKDWLKHFKTIRPFSGTNTNDYLWRLADLIRKDDFVGASKLTKPYAGLGREIFNIYPYICNRAKKDSRYLIVLNPEQASQLPIYMLNTLFDEGTIDDEALDMIATASQQSGKYDAEMKERIELYRFIVNGKYKVSEKPDTIWGICILAIKELYKGKPEDSLALFRSAMSKQGKKVCMFPLPLLNLFFTLCLLRYRRKYGMLSASDLKTDFESYLNRHGGYQQYASRMLLQYAELSAEVSEEEKERRVKFLLTYADNPYNKAVVMLIANYLDLPKDKFEDIDLPYQLLQHELSPYRATSSKTKAELEKTFGGKPLLANIPRRASWEMLLNEISSSVAEKTDERPRRIIYFLKNRDLSSVVQQVLHEDKWTDEKLISISKMATEGYESMDIIDSRIAMQYARKAAWETDADILIPNLIETDRLYKGVEYLPNRNKLEVDREVPFVEFTGEGESINISSNVWLDGNKEPRKHTVKLKEGCYSIVSLNPIQKEILSKLLKRESLPASAAPSLRPTIESIRGIIDVRENVLTDIVENAYESEGCIAVRIEPVKDLCLEYHVSFLAAPMADGITRITPATGELYVYDEDELGHTHCVHRNIAIEDENYQMLIDFGEQFFAEFTDYNKCIFGTEDALLHLLAFCHRYPDRFIVEWPNGQPLKFKAVITENDIEIDVKSDIDWFSVEGNVRVGNQNIDLSDFVESCSKDGNRDFVKIGEDEYIQLTDTLRKHIAELESVLTMGEKKGKTVPKYLVGVLANTIAELNNKTDNGYKMFLEKMKQAYKKEIPVPDNLNATLRPYQEDGFRWISRLSEWGAGACLADDMGLGKTLQALTFILSKADKGPSLVVGPKSVVPNWVNEVNKFAPTLTPIVLNDCHDRDNAIAEAAPGMLIICTYGVLTTERDLLSSIDWNVVCLDEAHQIKNRTTQVSQAAMSLMAQNKLILTGTPLQNHMGELWNLMQFINPGLLGRWSVFRDTYVNADLNNPQQHDHKDMLKEMTQPFILRRTKQEVLTDLPEKIEGIHYVTMSEDEATVYDKIRSDVELKFKKNKTREEKAIAASLELSYFQELLKLRQISCDMHLVYPLWKEQGTKIKALMEILCTLTEIPDNNILVFSQFTSFLDIVKKELKTAKIDFSYMDGQTPMKKRQKMVEEFQRGEKKLFLSSLKAGGLGINLTAANYVILLDPWWNPAIENQATDRAHRIGQQRCVSVIRLITENTIEEKILRLHEKKKMISDDVLNGTSESFKLTYEDILDMVTPF